MTGEGVCVAGEAAGWGDGGVWGEGVEGRVVGGKSVKRRIERKERKEGKGGERRGGGVGERDGWERRRDGYPPKHCYPVSIGLMK